MLYCEIMESRNEQSDELKGKDDVQTALIFLSGIVLLNGLLVASNLLFPGHVDGIGEWLFVEICIVGVVVGFAQDLRGEKVDGRRSWHYAVIYPAVWFGLGLVAYFFHIVFIA